MQVRSAIAKDFNLQGDAVQAQENKAEQTHVLIVRAGDVLPGGGTASVSYVFGFKSKTLIQVGLSWSKATDDAMTPEQLFSNANVLQSHFVSAGYKPDTVATNMPINGGILMFRGSDAQQHTAMLILQGTFSRRREQSASDDADGAAAVLYRRRQNPRRLPAAARLLLKLLLLKSSFAKPPSRQPQSLP